MPKSRKDVRPEIKRFALLLDEWLEKHEFVEGWSHQQTWYLLERVFLKALAMRDVATIAALNGAPRKELLDVRHSRLRGLTAREALRMEGASLCLFVMMLLDQVGALPALCENEGSVMPRAHD